MSQLYDHELLRRMTNERLDAGTLVKSLIDDSVTTVSWAGIDHCKEFCRQGHCHAIVKVLKCKEEGSRLVAQIAKKMSPGCFDAVSAGAHLIATPFFDILNRNFEHSETATLTEALSELASDGRVGYLSTEGLPWYSELIISRLGKKQVENSSVKPEWLLGVQMMLGSLKGCGQPSPPLMPARTSNDSVPNLINLGEMIGEGTEGRVVAADAPSDKTENSGALKSKPLAVKMIRKGRSCEQTSDIEQLIMWEVHVLRALGIHSHIVQVTDVVDLVDATYIVMERVDGPELADFIAVQPSGCVDPAFASRIFTQIAQALAHTHRRGYVHCDVKPQNIRLNAECNRAVLTDFGYALRIGTYTKVSRGTPTYAPPELLTGYCSDSISGKRPVCPGIDVWSLGVTLYHILVGVVPFKADTVSDLTQQVVSLEYKIPNNMPKAAAQLISEMLVVSPCERIHVDELLQSDWVKSSGALLPGFGAEQVDEVVCDLCDESGSLLSKEAPWWKQQRVRQALTTFAYILVCALTLLAHRNPDSEDSTPSNPHHL